MFNRQPEPRTRKLLSKILEARKRESSKEEIGNQRELKVQTETRSDNR
jgi:hypothetical protein